MTLILAGLFLPGLTNPRVEQLNCGLRVIVIEDHLLPLVSVQLWFEAGSAADPPKFPDSAN